MRTHLIALGGAALLLTACDDATTDSMDTAPLPAEQACLRDVAAATDNPDVAVLGSDFSEAGTRVRVGVGPDRAPWNCVAFADGSTAGIESLADEGAL